MATGAGVVPGVGWPMPLGASVCAEGVNFCIHSEAATAVSLLLFDHHSSARPAGEFRLNAEQNRSGGFWHVLLPGAAAGQLYGWRVSARHAPEGTVSADESGVLLDPYALAVMYPFDAERPSESFKSVVVDPAAYDWEGDAPLRRPLRETVIYELHVRGFTRHPSSGVTHPGTYSGLEQKLPYLHSLGVTAIELLPVQQFYPGEIGRVNPETGEQLRQFWGYQPVAWFAPHRGYCVNQSDPLAPVTEFRDMVKACHRAGIEVILDVVFNHTAEGGAAGPTFSWRGFDSDNYYLSDPRDRADYMDFSGCGNTVNANHPVVRRMILDCLHFWVRDMHVDGFRFDLAAALARGENGKPLEKPPVLLEIENDALLSQTKIIAEPWDAAGLYQLGSFPSGRWLEWNDRFRDDVRRFVRGDEGMVSALADRFQGSPDIFHGQRPQRSVNYVTCHDGFTLNDLVSYNQRDNHANGEDDADGSAANHSCNHGAEGPTADVSVQAVRTRQVKNALALLLLAQGTPMLLAGDEFRRTQQGNNNAYCQDNEISWVDWGMLREYSGLQRFVRMLLRFRAEWSALRLPDFPMEGQLHWHGVELLQPDLGHHSHTLAFTLRADEQAHALHMMVNAHSEAVQFRLPVLPERGWRRLLDTARASPDDINTAAHASRVDDEHYSVSARSVVVVIAH